MHGAAPETPSRLMIGRPELALIGITLLWGGTFLIVHQAMRHSGPLFFVGLRFGTAALIALPSPCRSCAASRGGNGWRGR
nr:hypothetical protein [Sphingobium fuliginis]